MTFYLLVAIFAGVYSKTANHQHIAFLVFAAITMGIMAAGPSTGGAINPCRVLGPSLMDGNFARKGNWIYYAGPLLGGALAGVFSLFFFKCDNTEKDKVKENLEEIEN